MKFTPEMTARRWFLQRCGIGLGAMAAGNLLHQELLANTNDDSNPNPLAPKKPHFEPKVKRVIYMFQAGAPSQLELFDHKQELVARNGQLPPASLLEGYRAAFIDPKSGLLAGKFPFITFLPVQSM